MKNITKSRNLKSELRDGTLYLFISGDLDPTALKSLRTEIDEKVQELRPQKLTLDFSGVEFANGSILGFIMGRYALTKELGITLSVANPSDMINRIFAMAGMDRLVKIERTQDAVCVENRVSTEGVRFSSPSLQKVVANMKMTLPAVAENEKRVRELCAGFVSQFSPAAEEVELLKLAVSAAFTNCVTHAYDGIGNVDITVRLYEDRTVRIDVCDKGRGIENLKEARLPLFTTKAENEHSGMGFTVMESSCDRIKVKSTLDKGTTVTLIKQF